MNKDIFTKTRLEVGQKLWSASKNMHLIALMLRACGSDLVNANSGSFSGEAIKIIASVGPVIDENGQYTFMLQASSLNPTEREFPTRFVVNGSHEIEVKVGPGRVDKAIFQSAALSTDPSAHVASSLGLIPVEGYCSSDENPDPLEIEVACWFNAAR